MQETKNRLAIREFDDTLREVLSDPKQVVCHTLNSPYFQTMARSNLYFY